MNISYALNAVYVLFCFCFSYVMAHMTEIVDFFTFVHLSTNDDLEFAQSQRLSSMDGS